MQQAAGSGFHPRLSLLKLLLYFVPEDLAKEGSLSIQRGKVLHCGQDGGEPLRNELPYAILVGKVGQQVLSLGCLCSADLQRPCTCSVSAKNEKIHSDPALSKQNENVLFETQHA